MKSRFWFYVSVISITLLALLCHICVKNHEFRNFNNAYYDECYNRGYEDGWSEGYDAALADYGVEP